MRKIILLAAAILAPALGGPAIAADPVGVVQRMYVFDCGTNLGKDQARWSPGVNAGQSILFSDNCYLIRHGRQTLIWDTGLADEIAAMPNGMETGGGAILARRTKTLAAQLAQIKVKPGDITFVALSHNHADHTGNAKLFPNSTFLVQKAEYDFAYADPAKTPLPAGAKVMQLTGDYDVFGDGSVMILSTPGHTPGHQSLLVNLRKTGPVVLTGDAAHFKDNFDNRRVPSMNADKDQTVASMNRLATLNQTLGAKIWINHDKPTSDTVPMSPKFLE